jgi:hypothetical protein
LGVFGTEWQHVDAPEQVHTGQKADGGVIAAGVAGDVTSVDFEKEVEWARVAS